MALSTSDDIAGTLKQFSAVSTSAPCLFIAPQCHPMIPIAPEAQEVPKHTGGQKPPACILPFKAPQPQRTAWNEQRGHQRPPRCRNPARKHKNAASIAWNALRHFLATSAMIGRIIAPDLDGANPQGVPLDSLASFRAVGQGEWVDTSGGF